LDSILQGADMRGLTLGVRPGLASEMRGPVPSPNIPSPNVQGQTAAVEADLQGDPQQGTPQRERGGARRTEVTVSPTVHVTIEGDASSDEVQEGIEAGNEDLERRMRRVLNEEQRTGF